MLVAYQKNPLARFWDLDWLAPVQLWERFGGNLHLCSSDQQGQPTLRADQRASCQEHRFEMLDCTQSHDSRPDSGTLGPTCMHSGVLEFEGADRFTKKRHFLLLRLD